MQIELRRLLRANRDQLRDVFDYRVAIESAAAEDPRILQVYRIQTVQRGPGEALVALKVAIAPDLTTTTIVASSITQLRTTIRSRLEID